MPAALRSTVPESCGQKQKGRASKGQRSEPAPRVPSHVHGHGVKASAPGSIKSMKHGGGREVPIDLHLEVNFHIYI